MSKIVAISDTHNMLSRVKIPEGDILVHAGDHTGRGRHLEVVSAMDELGKLKSRFKHIVLVAGNHDWLAQREPELFRSICADNGLVYLCDEQVELDGVRIYGSPWQPWFCNWAFNLPRGIPLKEKWDQIPTGLDILVTHGPPLYYGDLLSENGSEPGKNIGDKDLLDAIDRAAPKLHVFGHIHEGYGIYQRGSTTLINASICDEYYRTPNSPIEISLHSAA